MEKSLADGMKDRLQDMLILLDKNIIELVLGCLADLQYPSSCQRPINSRARISHYPYGLYRRHQFKVLQAERRLADRATQQNMIEQKETSRQDVIELKKQIDTLADVPVQIDQEISQLKTREVQLLKELEEVQTAIKNEEDKLNQLPKSIEKIKKTTKMQIRQTRALHQSIKPILGTAEDDNRQINEVDELRLCVMNVIQQTLGLL